MVAVRSRYSLGTLPVRSWYGILKVRSRLVFSTRLEPGTRTVRFIVRIAQSRLSWIRFGHRYYTLRNVLYSIYGLADSDRDNKLSVILIHYYTVDLGEHQGGAKDHAGLHWCGRGTARGAVEVHWCGRGMLVVQSRYARGTVLVRSWCGRGTLEVRSWCASSSLPVWCGSLTFQRAILYWHVLTPFLSRQRQLYQLIVVSCLHHFVPFLYSCIVY